MAKGSPERAPKKRLSAREKIEKERGFPLDQEGVQLAVIDKSASRDEMAFALDTVRELIEQEIGAQEVKLEHKDALVARVSRLRRSVEFKALAAMLRDPELRREYSMMLSRREEITATQERGEKHRELAPMALGLMMGSRTRRLLDLVIDSSTDTRSNALKEALERRTRLYVPEVVIGSGPQAAIYNINRQMVVPESSGLTVDSETRIGGQFAQTQSALFQTNSRTRPYRPGIRALPGTAQTLNTLSDWATTTPSDTSNLTYSYQSEIALHTRFNLMLAGETMVNVLVSSVRKAERGYLVTFFDEKTSKIFEVRTGRLIFATGGGTENIGLDEDDEETQRILDEEKDRYKRGEDARVMSYTEATRKLSDPEEPFPLRNFKQLVISGEGDGGNVLAGIFLGYEAQLAKSTIQLDYTEQIVWLGQPKPTKEDFLKACRARYARPALDFPRKRALNYYARVVAYPDIRSYRLRREPTGDIVVIGRAENGRTQEFQGDHFIYAHGFKSAAASILRGASFVGRDISRNPFSVEDINDGRPIATRYGLEEIYEAGPAADLRVTREEKRDVKALKNIPENSAALFRYEEKTAALAQYFARLDKDDSLSSKRSELFKDADELMEDEQRFEARNFAVRLRDKVFETDAKRPPGAKLPYDMPIQDILRFGLGVELQKLNKSGFSWKKLTRKDEIELTVHPGSTDPDGGYLVLECTIALPEAVQEYFKQAFDGGYATVAISRLVTGAGPSRPQPEVKITLPIDGDTIDIAKIRYEVVAR